MAEFFRWLAFACVLFLIGLVIPVVYLEASCRDRPVRSVFVPIVLDAELHRSAADSFLSYPRWHVAYVYEELGKTLESDDEFAFNYLGGVIGYWSSFCAMNKVAMRHGETSLKTRGYLHLLGIGFTADMAFKALYEETFGRLAAVFRGDRKTAQDRQGADMIADYAQFLKQAPWYGYDFQKPTQALWAEPVDEPLRGWERRISLGIEWQVKQALAYVAALSARGTGAENPDTPVLSVVSGLEASDLLAMNKVTIAKTGPDFSIIRTPAGEDITLLVQEIVEKGGTLAEIAGNEDILVSVIRPQRGAGAMQSKYTILARLPRFGFDDERLLLSVKVSALADLFADLAQSPMNLERIYTHR